MIIASCPFRISLVGGSTDHPYFIKKYGKGSVISFPCNLRCYVSIHKDVFGANSLDHKYVLSYSKKELVNNINEIENELIRFCFSELSVDKINCSLLSDIYSVGSGLATSSAYLMALIKAIYVLNKKSISDFELCKMAEKIEKNFNPLVGQQDFFGSLGGLKRINFYKDNDPSIRPLSTEIFNEMDVYLMYTGVLRSSTSVLKTIDTDKSLPLMQDVEDLENSIKEKDLSMFNTIMKRSWNNKKKTSKEICQNNYLAELDFKLTNDPSVLSHKLCGAGNGGYFLIFSRKDKKEYFQSIYKNIEMISISEEGPQYFII